MPQNPTRRVHALLDRMARGKIIVVENNRERGSKHCWENDTAKIPADMMTRLRAKCHNQKGHSQRRQLDDHDCQNAKPAERQDNQTKKQNR